MAKGVLLTKEGASKIARLLQDAKNDAGFAESLLYRKGRFQRRWERKYDGFFAVKNTSDDETQKVIISAGWAQVNDGYFNVEASEDIIITADTYIYLQTVVTDDIVQTPTIENSSTMYSYESGVSKVLLALVEWDSENEKIGRIRHQHEGIVQDVIFGSCDEEA